MPSPARLLPLLGLLVACSGKPASDAAADSGAGDTAPAGPAALATLSDGACPDMTTSGTSTFQSSGEDRQVTVIIPSSPQPKMAVDFFFHGVTDPSTTSNPGGDTATGLGLQALADSTNTVWIVPDAPVQNLLGVMNVYLWDLAQTDDHDLVLYDDLRTCVGQNLDVDLSRLSTVGFSGGALWNTVVLGNRADTIATAVELSGGSDVVVSGYNNNAPISVYNSPVTNIPVLLTTGADGEDVWPSKSMVVVDFWAASNTLQGKLYDDSHFVVRCADSNGHVMGNKDWNIAQAWIANQTYGGASEFQANGLGSDASWCADVTSDTVDTGTSGS